MPDKDLYVQEWLNKGSHDLMTADLAFKAGGLTDTVVVLLQQASEKYLKGYLLSKGWHLKRTHDLKDLLDSAIKYNPQFSSYLELVDRLTALYIEQRYPSRPGVEYPTEEIAQIIQQTKELIDHLKGNNI
jgi:HEPN domain-containing protein